ncbi:MAG: VWA domain-containing protein [Nannocystaceae bacterium]|nr:VWA domain-containing protein [bacterium]
MAFSRRALFLSSLLTLTGCPDGGGSGNPPPANTSAGNPTATMSGTGQQGTGTMTDTDATGGSSSSSGATSEATSTGATVTNCGDLQCSDNGSCEIDPLGSAYCLCDAGYVLDDAGVTCVVDESCIRVSFLEDGCRQKVNAEPAVALFFALDFCAGTAVTPEKRAELGLSFVVRENGIDISENVESDATILDTEVESYVTLMVDVSNSVTESEDLPALVTELRALVSSLEAAPGEPDVYVSVFVFGFRSAEYVPFTRDLAAVDAALEALANDPAPVVELASGGQSTALFNATEEGILATHRIRDLRDAVTWGGVLTTGTVVVVTDGIDTSNGDLNSGLIGETTNQVISIGISDAIDDDQLRAIGRDGSFLAPTPADWTTAFESIAERVDAYPDRSYLLAYCSSASEGDPDVEVSVTGPAVLDVTAAECGFNAELFSSQGFECNTDFFTSECNAQQCGGLTGCGACADSQCCNGTQCSEPEAAQFPVSCDDNIHLCDAENLACNGASCVLPVGDGQDCTTTPCAAGVDYCGTNPAWNPKDPDSPQFVCMDTLPLGTPCEVPEQCESLNCYYPNPDNPFEGRRCLPEAQLGDHCGDEDAVCESGGHCQSSTCEPKLLELASCNSDEQCRRGVCVNFDVGGNFCSGPAACYWSWDEKVPD